MLDLTEHRCEGEGVLRSAKFRRDAEVEGKLTVEFEVAIDVASQDDAEVVDRAVPGAATLYRRAAEARADAEDATSTDGAAAGSEALAGVAGKTKVKVGQPAVLVTVAAVDGGLVALSEVGGEILAASFRGTGRKIAYLLQVRLYDREPADAPGILALLGKPITLALERKQRSLFAATDDGAPMPKVGEVVTGDGWAGVVVGVGTDATEVQVDDCGTQTLRAVSAVASSFRCVPEEGKTMDATLAGYAKRARKQGAEPSWCHLIVAIGQLCAGQAAPVDDAWVVTADVVSRAVELAVEARPAQAQA